MKTVRILFGALIAGALFASLAQADHVNAVTPCGGTEAMECGLCMRPGHYLDGVVEEGDMPGSKGCIEITQDYCVGGNAETATGCVRAAGQNACNPDATPDTPCTDEDCAAAAAAGCSQ